VQPFNGGGSLKNEVIPSEGGGEGILKRAMRGFTSRTGKKGSSRDHKPTVSPRQ